MVRDRKEPLVRDDQYGKTVCVVFSDHESDCDTEMIGVFECIERLGDPEIFYVTLRVCDDPCVRRHIPVDDVIEVL